MRIKDNWMHKIVFLQADIFKAAVYTEVLKLWCASVGNEIQYIFNKNLYSSYNRPVIEQNLNDPIIRNFLRSLSSLLTQWAMFVT